MKNKKNVNYRELIRGFMNKGCALKNYGAIMENQKKYNLYKITINPRCQKTLLIVSGFHGEEFNGPVSLLEIFDEAAAYAKKMRVRLIIYPCVNPSGFNLRKRYNASDESPNNDFLRYEIKKDKWVGTLKPKEWFLSYKIINSAAKEVRLLKRDILKYPVPRGVLDIHQQQGNLKTGDFYAYIFNKRPVYLKIMKKLEKIAKVAKNDPAMNFEDGRKVYYRIDKNGFIFLHDGTLTDMFYRLGSKFAVAAETDTTLPLEKVCQINLVWIKELIKLVANKK
jgi:predicted deacylase